MFATLPVVCRWLGAQPAVLSQSRRPPQTIKPAVPGVLWPAQGEGRAAVLTERRTHTVQDTGQGQRLHLYCPLPQEPDT
jgi:hypothetical protein